MNRGYGSAARLQAKSRIDAIVDKRQNIQFAAEAVWPWHNDANLGIRKEFERPRDAALPTVRRLVEGSRSHTGARLRESSRLANWN